MANEASVTKIECNTFLEMETFVILRREYGKCADGGKKMTKSEIVRLACEDLAKGKKLTADELKECQEYYAANLARRMKKRESKRTHISSR